MQMSMRCGVSPVQAQMWERRAQPSPGADVAGVSPNQFPGRMWERRAQPSPAADVGAAGVGVPLCRCLSTYRCISFFFASCSSNILRCLSRCEFRTCVPTYEFAPDLRSRLCG